MSSINSHLTDNDTAAVANNFSSETQTDGVAILALTGYFLVIRD